MLHVLIIAILLVTITSAFGVVFYSADVPTGVLLLEFIAVVLVGAMSFAALGPRDSPRSSPTPTRHRRS